MTLQFNHISKGRLFNHEHFALHTEFRSGFTTRQAYMPPQARALFTQAYQPAYARLDEGIQKIRMSAITKQIAAKDRERDELYAGLVETVNGACKHYDPDTREKALRVKVFFKAYGNVAVKSLDEETSALYNLVQDLRVPARAEDVEALGLTEWVAALENRNNAVRNLLRQRDSEAAERTNVDVKAARAEIDAVYDQLTVLIETFILLNGDGNADNLAVAVSLVETFNEAIDRFKRRMNRRKRKPGAQDDDAADDGDADDADDGQGEE